MKIHAKPDMFHGIGCDAVISPCRRYRYLLSRQWGTSAKVGFVMLNPSTADHTDDDATIRRCIGFAKSWGYDGIEVCNLFAWRSTDPKQLSNTPDPVGPDNDEHLMHLGYRVPLLVAAWGNFPFAKARAKSVLKQLERCHFHCLGVNRNWSPKHPLYVPANATLFQIERERFYDAGSSTNGR